MFRTTYYSTRHQTDASVKENQSQEISKGIDESILSITKCLGEADIYVATSKSYIEGARGKIELLKKSLYQADVDLSTAEECIMESEMRLDNLKRELQLLFNKSFYSSPERVPKVIVDQSQLGASQATSEPLDSYSLPSNISAALKKYADSSKIDLENYKTSLEQHGNLTLIIMHPMDKEKSRRDKYMFSPTSSLHQEDTSKLDNLNNESGISHKEHLRKSNYFQTYNGPIIINGKEFSQRISEEQGVSFHSESSVKLDTSKKSQQRIESDALNYNSDRKALNDSVVTTGTLDINPNAFVKQNTTLDKVPDLAKALSFNSQSLDSRKWSTSDVRLPPRKRYASLTSDVSPIRLSDSSGLPSSKRTSAGSSQCVLVKIHSSESGDSEWESTLPTKEKCTKMPEDKLSEAKNETKDLIKLSSSGSSETSPLKETGLLNGKTNENVSIDIKMDTGNEFIFYKDTQISNSFKSIHSSDGCNTFTKNYLQSSQPERNVSYLQSCRPKTLSQSFRERRTREKETSSSFDDSLEKVPLSKITKIRNSEAFGSQKLRHLKIQSQENDVENITLDALSLTGSIEINDAYTDPLSYYKTTHDYPQSKQFRTPQYRDKSKSPSADNLSVSANNSKSEKYIEMINNQHFKVHKNSTKKSNDTAYSSVGKSSTSENITTSSSSHNSHGDEFCNLQAKQRFNPKSPSYFSFTEDVFYPLKNCSSFNGHASASNVTSPSVAMNTSTSTHAGNSTANLLQSDDSFSSENANNSISIQVNTSDASITSESLRTVNETFSKPLFEKSYSSDDFSARDNFDESVPRRESTESYVTVYEAQMPSLSESASNFSCYKSGELVQRSGLDIISEEYNAAANIPRISITSCHSRNSLYSYIPRPRISTSTPNPDTSFSEV